MNGENKVLFYIYYDDSYIKGVIECFYIVLKCIKNVYCNYIEDGLIGLIIYLILI